MPGEKNLAGQIVSDFSQIEEVCVNERRLFDGKILNLRCDEVRTPSGHIATR